MMFRRLLAAALLLLAMAVVVACGGGRPEPTLGPEIVQVTVVVPAPLYTPGPTATAYPTFTPLPTPTPTLPPTNTPWPTPTRTPLPTPLPTPTPAETEEPEPELTPSPTGPAGTPGPTQEYLPIPTPFGRMDVDPDNPDDDLYLVQQSLFPYQYSEPPEFLVRGDMSGLPQSEDFISRTTRYIYWVLYYEERGGGLPEDWSMKGYWRLTDLGTDILPAFAMIEQPITITKEGPSFMVGIGKPTPGFWQQGRYRFDFMDDKFNEVAFWEFEVR